MKQTIAIFLTMAAMQTLAQNKWTMQQCMLYAVEHNHEVRQAELELDNRMAAKKGAVGDFRDIVAHKSRPEALRIVKPVIIKLRLRMVMRRIA